MCRVEFLLGKLVGKCIICRMLVLVGGNFFIGGALVGHIENGGRMLGFIGKLWIEVVFLL